MRARWFGLVHWRLKSLPSRCIDQIVVDGATRTRSRPRWIWIPAEKDSCNQPHRFCKKKHLFLCYLL